MARGFPHQVPHLTQCEVHGKKVFTKKNAKRLIRRLSERKGMREYPCSRIFDGWHVGHMPLSVRQGEVTTREIYEAA